MNVDDVFEDIVMVRGLGGEGLPVTSYAIRSSQIKSLLSAIEKGYKEASVDDRQIPGPSPGGWHGG